MVSAKNYNQFIPCDSLIKNKSEIESDSLGINHILFFLGPKINIFFCKKCLCFRLENDTEPDEEDNNIESLTSSSSEDLTDTDSEDEDHEDFDYDCGVGDSQSQLDVDEF